MHPIFHSLFPERAEHPRAEYIGTVTLITPGGTGTALTHGILPNRAPQAVTVHAAGAVMTPRAAGVCGVYPGCRRVYHRRVLYIHPTYPGGHTGRGTYLPTLLLPPYPEVQHPACSSHHTRRYNTQHASPAHTRRYNTQHDSPPHGYNTQHASLTHTEGTTPSMPPSHPKEKRLLYAQHAPHPKEERLLYAQRPHSHLRRGSSMRRGLFLTLEEALLCAEASNLRERLLYAQRPLTLRRRSSSMRRGL